MKSARGSSAAATTKRSSRHRRTSAGWRSPRSGTRRADGAARRLRANKGVVLIVDGFLAELEHVQETPVRNLYLDEPLGPHRGRAPVVHKPDESFHGRRQVDLDFGDRRHGERERGVA